MDSNELEELADAIVDGMLQDAPLSIEKLPSFAKQPERLLAYELDVVRAQKEALEDVLYDLLLDYYGLDCMGTAAFDLHQELVILPRIAQSETDAAVSNYEAMMDAELQGGG